MTDAPSDETGAPSPDYWWRVITLSQGGETPSTPFRETDLQPLEPHDYWRRLLASVEPEVKAVRTIAPDEAGDQPGRGRSARRSA